MVAVVVTPDSMMLSSPALQPRWVPVATGNLALALGWLWLSLPTLGWLARTFTLAESRTNAVLLGLTALWVMVQLGLSQARSWRTVLREPRLRLAPLLLLAVCATGQFLKPHLLGSNVLASVFFALGSYALVGLYLPRARWRRGLALVLLAVLLLPFGTQLDALLGFPLRIASARAVETLLQAAGVSVRSAEAIVIFENGVADIDLPCSGVKGLWVGSVLFAAMTLLERRALGLGWLGVGGLYAGALLAANGVRVLLVVVIGVAWAMPDAASLIHLPLGVFGFVAASAVAIFLLRRVPRHPDGPPEPACDAPLMGRKTLGAAALLALLAFARPSVVPEPSSFAPAQLQFPSGWEVQPLALTPAESELFGRHQAHSASKWRFQAQGHRGSLLMVVARSFRAHHAPEVCLAGAGHRLDQLQTGTLPGGFPFKAVDLDGGQAWAAYWFQSPTRTTDGLLQRTLGEVLDGERRWALISVLLDSPGKPDDATSSLLGQLHRAVGDSLLSNATPQKEL